MRIGESKRSTQVSSKPKAAGSGASQGTFAVDGSAKSSAAKGTTSVRALAAMDALISIQEVPDATARRSKAIARAQDMLDLLEEIKLAILTGALPRARINKLARIVAEVREDVGEEGLTHVLDEIELRARVELAKLERAA